ncbi:hypothetical protein L2E82_07323 [Cichorium intybus]|uniref:Uncharacterized protein n=1 Tax=Cichorium intybus TaxID=13427 RepID=A0ACB9G443_CICIN|nr:hypothetical protein L2E82_07323 [Cichorium intybus]
MRTSASAVEYYGRENMYASPSPSPHELYAEDTSLYYLHSVPVTDFATLSVVAFLLFLSLLSFFCIFHIRLKSRSSLHLRRFNKLWTVRLLLVVLVTSWAVTQIPRLPFIREPLTFSKQANICKFHVVLSLGFLEPGFLVTLLYLINVSIKQRDPFEKWSVFLVIVTSLPTLILQIMFLFFTPLKEQLPWVMTRTSLLSVDGFGNKRMICTYPWISLFLFCAFAIMYSMGLLLACWRVVSLVINKTIRVRINMLGLTVMMALLVQTLFLGAESLWMPVNIGVSWVSFGVFLSVAICAVVGEIVLVIKPIMEALATDKDYLNLDAKRPIPNAGSVEGHCDGRLDSFS